MEEEKIYDCIIVGAGPGGLQAAIYLGRYNRNVLLIDRGGGRTLHAKQIENFLSWNSISGKEIIDKGIDQAKAFGASIEAGRVTGIAKSGLFHISADKKLFLSEFVIVSSGVRDNIPNIRNLHKFFGKSFFTCVDCDGYNTTGKKLVIIGDSIETVRLAFAMKQMFTKDITLILISYSPPADFRGELSAEAIELIQGAPREIIGTEKMEAIELEDGRRFACDVILSDFGFELNDDFLAGLSLQRDSRSGHYVVSRNYESSLTGLYIIGPLNTGQDQAVIAAGEGAAAAIDINKRLLKI
ncbi:MAG: NAD(P)/FAD-dependent oxidoreductase [Nitrospirota bacterium]